MESGGTKSLIAQALRLGDIKSESDPLLLGPAEMKAAYDQLTEEDQQVLIRTKVCARCGLGCQRCCFVPSSSSSSSLSSLVLVVVLLRLSPAVMLTRCRP